MLLDYQQGGMVLDGLISFPDWTFGGSVAEETNNTTGGVIILQGSAGGPYAGNVKVSIPGAGVPHLATIAPPSP